MLKTRCANAQSSMEINVADLDILYLGFYLDPYLLKAQAASVQLKKVFLEISQNSQKKHLCLSLFFNKVAGLSLQIY